MSSKIHVLENTAMSLEIQRCPRKLIQRDVLGNTGDVLENTAGCPLFSEIQQNVSEIQGTSSEIFTAGVLGNAEDVLGNAMSSEIQRDVLGNRVDVLGNTWDVLDDLGNTAGSVLGCSAAQETPPRFGNFLGDVLEIL